MQVTLLNQSTTPPPLCTEEGSDRWTLSILRSALEVSQAERGAGCFFSPHPARDRGNPTGGVTGVDKGQKKFIRHLKVVPAVRRSQKSRKRGSDWTNAGGGPRRSVMGGARDHRGPVGPLTPPPPGVGTRTSGDQPLSHRSVRAERGYDIRGPRGRTEGMGGREDPAAGEKLTTEGKLRDDWLLP